METEEHDITRQHSHSVLNVSGTLNAEADHRAAAVVGGGVKAGNQGAAV